MDVAARHILREAHRRYVASATRAPSGARVGDMLQTRFPYQRAFMQRQHRRKALLGTRRAGKTETAPAYLLQEAEAHDGVLILYVAITRIRAKELLWQPLKDMAARFGFAVTANETELSLRLSNGSTIRLTGADKLREAEKKRGDKCWLVFVDEAQMYAPQVLQVLVDDIFGPTLEDLLGTLVLSGTPGPVCAGYWYDVTRNEDEASRGKRARGWDVHEWNVLDNPAMAHMRQRLPEMLVERGWTEDTPTFVREWRGRWVNDAGSLFYSFGTTRNVYDGSLPAGIPWMYVLGADLGVRDAFAYHVWAFSPSSPDLYEVESFSESGLLPAQWAAKLKAAKERWSPIKSVVDTGGLGAAIVEEWKPREGLYMEPAQKTEKATYVALLNGDLMAGRIHMRAGSPTANEMAVLPKDPEKPEREHPGFPNHCCDAALYAWREAYHFLGRKPDDGPAPGTEAYWQQEAARMEAEDLRRFEEEESES